MPPQSVVMKFGDTSVQDAAALRRLVTASARVIRNAATVTAVGEGVTGHAAVWSVLAAAGYAGHVERIVPGDSGNAVVCVTSRALAPRLRSHLHDSFWPSDVARTTRAEAAAGAAL